MNKPRSPRRNVARMIMVVLGLQLCLAGHLGAFAVGDLTVHSHRGEPFVAEVRLLLGLRERDKDVEVTLGNQEVYRAEGFRRAAIIDTLKAIMAPGAHDMIRLSSSVPMQESAFDLVLSVRAGQLTIVKHYDVTLPPPAPASAQIVAPLPTIAQVVPLTRAPKAIAKPTRPPRRAERYGPVERGETLYSIAKALHVPNEKIWQAIVALWRSNKGQFFAGNLHGLQAGTFLEVPSDLAESMAAMRTAEAQEIVANQWEEWHTPQRMAYPTAHGNGEAARHHSPRHRGQCSAAGQARYRGNGLREAGSHHTASGESWRETDSITGGFPPRWEAWEYGQHDGITNGPPGTGRASDAAPDTDSPGPGGQECDRFCQHHGVAGEYPKPGRASDAAYAANVDPNANPRTSACGAASTPAGVATSTANPGCGGGATSLDANGPILARVDECPGLTPHRRAGVALGAPS